MNIISIDECGRGSGYGPISIGMLPITYNQSIDKHLDNKELEILNWANSVIGKPLKSLDSKTITPKRRELLFDAYKEPFIVLFEDCSDITYKGLLDIKINLMITRGLQLLEDKGFIPDLLLCDGSIYPLCSYQSITITKGDYKYPSIGLSSILCKVLRDTYINSLSTLENPMYDLVNNKGYLTAKHIEAIGKLGMTSTHRPLFCNKFIR